MVAFFFCAKRRHCGMFAPGHDIQAAHQAGEKTLTGQMHWSRPAAERTLRALRHFNGSATTMQIHEVTQSQAVHSDVSSLRCYVEEVLGLDPTEHVFRRYVGRTEKGRQIHEYTISRQVMFGRPVQAALFTTEAQREG